MKDGGRIVTTLLEHLRPLMAQEYRADSCIAACRIAKSVLDHFHIHFEPQIASVFVANKKLWKRMRVEAVEVPLRDGEWSVGCGFGYDPRRKAEDGFNGHLILVRQLDAAHEILLDPSIDQCSRPEQHIVLKPLWQVMPIAWRTEKLAVHLNGCALIYQPLAANEKNFRDAPDWRTPSRTSHIREAMVAALIDLLEKEAR